MQTFYHGYELFGASIFPQQLTQSSPPKGVEYLREVDKDNIQRSILLYALFLEKIMSTVLRFEQKPHCVPGTTSGVMWLESMFSSIRANILPAAERRDILR